MCKIKYYNKKYLEILNGNPVIKGNILKRITSSNDELINEDIYRLVSYDRFYDFLKNSKTSKFCLKYSQVMDLFPVNSVEYRKMRKYKHRSFNMILDIAICDFNNVNDVYDSIKYFVVNPSDELVQSLYESTCESGNPCTCNIDENKVLILLPNDFTKIDLRHEFIHYLQFVKSDISSEIQFDSFDNDITKILENNFYIDESTMTYLNDLTEYEPLLNDFFDDLKKVKDIYYKDLPNLQFARFMYKLLFRQMGESDKNYLNKILNYEYFNELNKVGCSYGFQLIIYFNLLKYRVTQIKHLLFGYFSKPLLPKY